MGTRIILVISLTLVLMRGARASSTRCNRFLSALSSCKVSCKILGHDTGACDNDNLCVCSGEEYDFFKDVSGWLDEEINISEAVERMKNRFSSLKENVLGWDLSKNLRELVPSKCKISQEFCSGACHSIGRVSGRCNADNTDCDCSDDWVTPKQYGLCASESICTLDCQANGFTTGSCQGQENWDCQCQ